MELIRGLSGLRPRHRPCVATIGAFDGVHRGHQVVIGQLREQAREHDLPATVITFEPHPREYLQPEQAPARLSTLRDKYEQLAACGVDRLLCLQFNEALRHMSAAVFAGDILIDGLGIRSLILGDDFRFGRAREGDLNLMRKLGARHGFETQRTRTVEHDGERISSTRLRGALAAGDFALAAALLGRPFTISGRVTYGRQLGRSIGAPTANIPLRRLVSPLAGVYAATVSGAGLHDATAVANLGTRPTVTDSACHNLEVHVLDTTADLYGQRLQVTPRARLRAERKFESLQALQAQIARDRDDARRYFAAANEYSEGA